VIRDESTTAPAWRDAVAAPGTPEARAADLVRKMGEPDLPSDERMAVIRSRIVLRRGRGRGLRRARRGFTWALVTAALLVGATLGAAARNWIEPLFGGSRAEPARGETPPSPASPPSRRARASRPAEASPPPAPTEQPPVAEPAPPVMVTAPSRAEEDPAKGRASRPARLGEPRGSLRAPSGGSSEEARLLGLAIRRLRRDHDARGGLAALDQRAREFPRGALDAEADLVRVEALLMLDDRAGALRLLDERELAAAPRARQALELRGELRAAVGRCAEAVVDLERAIGPSSAGDSLAERGLFARASCLSRLHKYPEARGDLEAYLRRFPNGPRAAAVAEALRSLPRAQ
jgi:hypothetical protein